MKRTSLHVFTCLAVFTFLFGGIGIKNTEAVSFFVPRGIAIDANGDLIVTGFFGGSAAVARIEPTTGIVSIISSGGNFATATTENMAIASNGDIFVNEFGNRSGGDNRITLVDPITGTQTYVVKGGIFPIGAGGLGGVAIDANGDILTTDCLPDNRPSVDCVGRIISTDPLTGNQTIIFSQDDFRLKGIAIDAAGDILAVVGEGSVVSPRVIRVNPGTGTFMVISSGENFENPYGIAIDATGDLLVVDRARFPGDPLTSS